MASFASSYIPTVASQVTRAKDQISDPVSNLPWSATQGILAIQATTPPASVAAVLAQIDDGTANNRIRIERNTSNEIHCIVTTGGIAQCDLNMGAVANSTSFKIAFNWVANDFAASLNGGALVTDVSGTIPTVTTLKIGQDASANWNSWIKNMRYLPRTRTSTADLQALAT